MKIAILDDETHCVESLVIQVNKLFPEATVVFKSTKPLEALEVLQRIETDILLLDVEMPNMSGFDFLAQFTELPFDVIFTTAYSQYAVKAFRANAIDYLLKPIAEDELRQALENWQQRQQRLGPFRSEIEQLMETIKKGDLTKRKIAIPTSNGMEFIAIDKIIYCQAQSNYTTIVTEDNQTRLVSRTLKDVGRQLEKYSFVRVHQSYLINPNFVERFIRTDGGYLILSNNHRIPISQGKRGNLTGIFLNLRDEV